jgi:hypothetical protein
MLPTASHQCKAVLESEVHRAHRTKVSKTPAWFHKRALARIRPCAARFSQRPGPQINCPETVSKIKVSAIARTKEKVFCSSYLPLTCSSSVPLRRLDLNGRGKGMNGTSLNFLSIYRNPLDAVAIASLRPAPPQPQPALQWRPCSSTICPRGPLKLPKLPPGCCGKGTRSTLR